MEVDKYAISASVFDNIYKKLRGLSDSLRKCQSVIKFVFIL